MMLTGRLAKLETTLCYNTRWSRVYKNQWLSTGQSDIYYNIESHSQLTRK